MSQSNVSVQRITSVQPHPNADRLEIAEVCGYTVVVPKGEYRAEDTCVFFPPDNLIPPDVSESLGVAKYLKHALYPGDLDRTQCRIGAARIRGMSSFGFIIKTDCTNVGQDLNDAYRVVRYEPAPKIVTGEQVEEHPLFFRYTEIENVQRFPNLIPEGTQVVYTEKIHGANCRIGVIDGEVVAGSHRTQVKSSLGSLYWTPYGVCQPLLADMQEDGVDILIFGEVFGPGVQDLHYGQDKPQFRCFDIAVGGRYLDALHVLRLCDVYGIPTVPVLGSGPYSRATLDSLTDGRSNLADHIREGVVVKALEETVPRRILKSVSVDYLSRE